MFLYVLGKQGKGKRLTQNIHTLNVVSMYNIAGGGSRFKAMHNKESDPRYILIVRYDDRRREENVQSFLNGALSDQWFFDI